MEDKKEYQKTLTPTCTIGEDTRIEDEF